MPIGKKRIVGTAELTNAIAVTPDLPHALAIAGQHTGAAGSYSAALARRKYSLCL